MARHVLSITDLAPEEIAEVLRLAREEAPAALLAGRGVVLIFEHPSARTRNSSEMAVFQLGGHPVSIRGDEIGFDRRESVEDVARTLAGYYTQIGARVASHRTLERLAAAIDDHGADVSVINLLSDYEHPAQALADLLTIEQHFGSLAGRKVAFIGDANNVARSLGLALASCGAELRLASPVGFTASAQDRRRVADLGGRLVLAASPEEAAAGADVLYTDVWISMGEEAEAAAKRQAFAGYTIDGALLALAAPGAVVLHCLPAHRGEEISAEVLEGTQSLVFQQAANRMHAMRGLIWFLESARAR